MSDKDKVASNEIQSKVNKENIVDGHDEKSQKLIEYYKLFGKVETPFGSPD